MSRDMTIQSGKKEKRNRSTRTPARLPIINACARPDLHDPSNPREFTIHILNYRHPRTRNADGTHDAVPTPVKVYRNAAGAVEAEPQSLETHTDTLKLPEIPTLERTIVTEQQLYMITLVIDNEHWPMSYKFWSNHFNICDEWIFKTRLEFIRALKSGDLDGAWDLAHQLAVDILRSIGNMTPEQGFWEMNDLINEAERPACAFLSQPRLEHCYVIREDHSSTQGLSNENEHGGAITLVQAASEAITDPLVNETNSDSKSSGSESSPADTPGSADVSSEIAVNEEEYRSISFNILDHMPNSEDIVFLARFPISKELAQSQSPTRRTNDRAILRPPLHTSSACSDHQESGTNTPHCETRMNKKKRKKTKPNIAGTLARTDPIASSDHAGEQKGPCDKLNGTKEYVEEDSNGDHHTSTSSKSNKENKPPTPVTLFESDSVNSKTIPSEPLESSPSTSNPIDDPAMENNRPSSEYRRSMRSAKLLGGNSPSDQNTNLNMLSNDLDHHQNNFTAGAQDNYEEMQSYDSLVNEAAADGSRKANLVTSGLSVEPSEWKSDMSNPNAKDEATPMTLGGGFSVDNVDDVRFLYCTWKGLEQAKQGVKELANIFGVEWVAKGIVLYTIDENWHIVDAA